MDFLCFIEINPNAVASSTIISCLNLSVPKYVEPERKETIFIFNFCEEKLYIGFWSFAINYPINIFNIFTIFILF